MNIDKPQCNLKTCRYCHDHNCFSTDYERCEYTLAKRPRGEWKWKSPTPKTIMTPHCSNCGHMNDFLMETNFCPNCGAPMTEEAFRKYNGLKEGEAK